MRSSTRQGYGVSIAGHRERPRPSDRPAPTGCREREVIWRTAPLPDPPSRGGTDLREPGRTGGWPPTLRLGHSDVGPPDAICKGEPGNLHSPFAQCQPGDDLRQRENPQVSRGRLFTRSSPEISPERRVARRHAAPWFRPVGSDLTPGTTTTPVAVVASERLGRASPRHRALLGRGAARDDVDGEVHGPRPGADRVISQAISRTSPARTGCLNCTSEYDANRPSSPSVRMHISVATSPKRPRL